MTQRMIAHVVLACVAAVVLMQTNRAAGQEAKAHTTASPLSAEIVRSPYVWKTLSGTDAAPVIEAAMPGAYLRATVGKTTTIGLVVDGSGNAGCPADSMPVIEYSVDEQPFKIVPLTKHDARYVLPLAEGLDASRPHRVEVVFRAADLTAQRWTSPKTRLRIAGLELDRGGELLPTAARPKRAIGFGDSITEGVGVDGLFTSWQSLGVNSARTAWFPLVATALDCEYGQLGSGGQGMVRGLELPPLPETWSRFDSEASRLTGGRLDPQPDYVFCAMGTNDFEKNIAETYAAWLRDVRAACPTSQIFCVIPPLGVHDQEIRDAVAERRAAGDERVHVVETAALAPLFRAGQGATQLAADGVHPTLEGQGRLAALIAVAVAKADGEQ
ncbi:hypothetical protein PLANPX_6065 [Lacipirellula parvula]|uniref:SGNH hydrolase-type esterase domain-containing protein n=2 Tax=Lacipirellula parvula TaxID=2650471 RepID=A0A5K7XNL0_9BACT|nr:hypothetical protein PLANPX_6065 [Lacipirellula parvula]